MCDNGKNKYANSSRKTDILGLKGGTFQTYATAESIVPSLDIYESKYLKYKAKYMKLKKTQFLMKGGSDINTLYLFKAEWCPHCINFRETWDTLQKDMKGKVNFIAYDADKDKSIMKKYNVEGFPTLMLKTKGKVIEYVGERDINGIKQFVKEYSS